MGGIGAEGNGNEALGQTFLIFFLAGIFGALFDILMESSAPDENAPIPHIFVFFRFFFGGWPNFGG